MEFAINGFSVPLIIQRKEVKGINVTVKWDGRVIISAPRNVSDGLIEGVLVRKAGWITKKLEEMEASRKYLAQFVDGGSIWLLGEPLSLRVVNGKKDKVILKGKRLVVRVSDGDSDRVKQLVIDWLQGQAIKVLHDKVSNFAQILGVNPKGVELRDWKGKLGLCETDREVLRFNWKLIQLPEDLIDYIVVHELAHLKHPNHNKGFWSFVSKCVPEWKEKHSKLREWKCVFI